jgi:hypothetical protein
MAINGKRKRFVTKEDAELAMCAGFMTDIGPSRLPTIRIYRLEPHQKQLGKRFRKQTRPEEVLLSDFSHNPSSIFEYVRDRFGAGEFLLRIVRSNGTWGPSRVIGID